MISQRKSKTPILITTNDLFLIIFTTFLNTNHFVTSINYTLMAEEEKKEEVPYQFTVEGGAPTNSSKDYTGKGLANYPNGEIY